MHVSRSTEKKLCVPSQYACEEDYRKKLYVTSWYVSDEAHRVEWSDKNALIINKDRGNNFWQTS